ncbi:hypothetical protein BDV93DRAFT_566896 [Ceratobasidium sp. AG-I]|nr:hypothetical protein BDV93DRAFT_566896 [Ceratobasidium sp. AG-I]
MNITIDTKLPQAVFFIAAILLFIGAGIVMLIRDEDRYITPEEAIQNTGFDGDCPPEDGEVGIN